MDIFAGSGTTLWVAKRMDRKYIGIELSSDYISLINKRLAQSTVSDFTSKSKILTSPKEKGFNMHLNENHNSFCDFPKLVNQPPTTSSPTCLNANIKRNFSFGSQARFN